MTRAKERERVAINAISKELEEDGYMVFTNPEPSLIPFDLKNYRPDIIAKKDGQNLIVEVKLRRQPRTIERYKEIAEIISQQAGWRFMLSTVDENYPVENPTIKPELEPEAIQRAILKIDPLFDSENFELALPYLWTIYISGMRIVGRDRDVPMDATTDRSVLNYMYSLGEISYEEYEKSKAFLDSRNRLIHTFDVQISKDQANELRRFAKQMLFSWNLVSSSS